MIMPMIRGGGGGLHDFTAHVRILVPCTLQAMMRLVLFLFLLTPFHAPAADFRAILSTYCLECHKEGKEADFLAVKELSQINTRRGHFRSAIEQLRNRTMPPPKDDQPTEDDRRKVADWLERVLRETAKEMGPYAGAVTARRLNRLEYDNTVRDLLGLRFKFSQTFPSDGGGGEGFDNNGETLYLPVILMERYLDAAEAILDEAVLVLGMTESHRAMIQFQAEPPPKNLHLFREFMPQRGDKEIGDPFGGPLRLYESTRDEMVEAIPSLVEFIKARFAAKG